MRCTSMATLLVLFLFAVAPASAAFLVQVDTDGLDDGPFTPSPNFVFGGDTTTASTSIPSKAPLLPMGDSLFGGDGILELDTYVYRYDPTTDADNLATGGILLGIDLAGDNARSSGRTGGSPGMYAVYAAWPATSNVSGGNTSYLVESGSNNFTAVLDQNTANDPDGDDDNDLWVLLGRIDYDGTSGIIVSQIAGSNTFVSMRASAVLFEPVPEPAAITLFALSSVGMLALRRRS